FGLRPALLQGRTLINTDSEQEGELCIGCAGGANVTGRLPVERLPLKAGWHPLRLAVTGLKGGHSGVDIHRGRGNAIRLLFRILRDELVRQRLKLLSLDAGNLRNAIPREAYAVIAVPTGTVDGFQERLRHWQGVFLAELQRVDPGLRVAATEAGEHAETWIGDRAQARLIHAVSACPNGVLRMSDDMPGLVESSCNLSLVRSLDGGEIEIQTLVRSSVDTARDDICRRIESLFALAGAESLVDGEYPGWQPDPASALLQRVKRVYRARFGRDPTVGAIHAGLECGIIRGCCPEMEMISFGPTIRDPHSPDERVHIPSVARFWDLLTGTLAQAPALS
ncbi:MAG TPA: M20/M25/M40 family metallo-hydrolase, partial [Sedimenticola sp.]|nr:M20/M25/M40 family metallo-hydrolase [Sedimenticola sp.]